jgi:hypothetical protein
MLEHHRMHSGEVDAPIEALPGRRLLAGVELLQLPRQGLVVLTLLLHGPLVGAHFDGEVTQSGLAKCVVLAVLMPIACEEGEENAGRDERDFDDHVEE